MRLSKSKAHMLKSGLIILLNLLSMAPQALAVAQNSSHSHFQVAKLGYHVGPVQLSSNEANSHHLKVTAD